MALTETQKKNEKEVKERIMRRRERKSGRKKRFPLDSTQPLVPLPVGGIRLMRFPGMGTAQHTATNPPNYSGKGGGSQGINKVKDERQMDAAAWPAAANTFALLPLL